MTGRIIDLRPVVTLERNNAGRLYIGVDEFGADGFGVRSYVLSHQDEHTADVVMERRYADMVRLMGDNIRTSREATPVTELDPAVKATLDKLANVLANDDSGAIDYLVAVSALATELVLTTPQVQYLADILELCPMHLCHRDVCADDGVQVCADVRQGIADLPDRFDFANPPQD